MSPELLSAIAATVGFLTVVVSPWAAFLGMLFLLPASGVYFDPGVSLLAWKFLAIPLIPIIFLRVLKKGTWTAGYVIAAYVLDAFLIAAFAKAFLVSFDTSGYDFRINWRWLIQAGTVLISTVPFFGALAFVDSPERLRTALRAFYAGILAIAVSGIIQAIAGTLFDFEIFGIVREGLGGAGEAAQAYFVVQDMEIRRINGLAREPKDLAAILVFGIALAYWARDGIASAYLFRPARDIVIFLVVLVLTYATTGFVLISIFAVCALMSHQSSRIARGSFRAIVAAFLFAGIAFITYLSFGSEFYGEIFEQRVTERIGNIEDYDEVTMNMFLSEPWRLLIGVGPGLLSFFAADYLPDNAEMLEYMQNFTWDAKAGLLKLIGGTGLIGLSLTVWAVAIVGKELLRSRAAMRAKQETIWFRLGWLLIFVSVVHALRAVDEFFYAILGLGAVAAGLITESSGTRSVPAAASRGSLRE